MITTTDIYNKLHVLRDFADLIRKCGTELNTFLSYSSLSQKEKEKVVNDISSMADNYANNLTRLITFINNRLQSIEADFIEAIDFPVNLDNDSRWDYQWRWQKSDGSVKTWNNMKEFLVDLRVPQPDSYIYTEITYKFNIKDKICIVENARYEKLDDKTFYHPDELNKHI